MPVTGAVVALALIIIAAAVWMVRQHSEAVRNVPIVAGALGALLPMVCVAVAAYLLASPIVARMPAVADVLGYSAAATQTAVALLPQTTPTPTPPPPTAVVVPTPEFTPYWVRNHRRAQIWSGRAGPP